MTAASVSVVVTSFMFGLLGAFYLSAQALGFDNLKKVASWLSSLTRYVGPIEIRVVDSGEYEDPSLLDILAGVPRVWAYFINAFVFHSALGIVLATGWLVATAMSGINVPLYAQVIIAVALYVLGSWAFGERPHDAVKRFANAVIGLLHSHLRWVEDNTREGGRTGVLGFSLLSLGLALQLVGNLLALQR